MININPKNYESENILSNEEIIEELNKLKKQGKKIGLCSGSFDLLHPGHINHLISAKKNCDILVVAIARDNFSKEKSIKRGRPIFSHNLRAFMISKLKPVDFVILDEGTVDTLYLIKPDIYIKGIDYADEKDPRILHTKKIIEELGGKIHFTPNEKISTTNLIKYIKEEIV